MRASDSVGSLISSRKIGKTLPSFLLFKRSALAKVILFKSRNSLNSESEISLSWDSFYSKTFGLLFVGLEGFGETVFHILA